MLADSGATIFAPTATAPAATEPERTSPDNNNREGTSLESVANKIGLPKMADVDMAQVSAKVDQLKKWTIGTLKNSKQQFLEQLGKVDRTVDPEFDQQCDKLKELHRRYGVVVSASRHFSNALRELTIAQKTMADSLYQLSESEGGLKEMCSAASDSMRKVGDHATSLENCLKYFLSSMETIHTKSIADTLSTIYSTEASRIEYDVHRHELSSLQMQATASPTAIHEAQQQLERHREKYEQYKTDVRVKLRLLEENRIGVMAKQLEKLHSALCAYFSGNAELLSAAINDLAAMQPSKTSFLTV